MFSSLFHSSRKSSSIEAEIRVLQIKCDNIVEMLSVITNRLDRMEKNDDDLFDVLSDGQNQIIELQEKISYIEIEHGLVLRPFIEIKNAA